MDDQEPRKSRRAARGRGPRARPDEPALPVPLDPAPLPPPLRERIAAARRGESLAAEIGALRAVLIRLLATAGDDPAQLAQSVPRVVDAIVRALRTQRLLLGDAAGDRDAMIARVLANLEARERREEEARERGEEGGA